MSLSSGSRSRQQQEENGHGSAGGQRQAIRLWQWVLMSLVTQSRGSLTSRNVCNLVKQLSFLFALLYTCSLFLCSALTRCLKCFWASFFLSFVTIQIFLVLAFPISPWAEEHVSFWCCQIAYLYCFVCVCSFVEHIHLPLQFLVVQSWLTGRLSVYSMSLFLWVSVCAFSSPYLLSFRHYQTKAYFKIFWKRYISLISFHSSLPCLFVSLPVLFSVCVTR